MAYIDRDIFINNELIPLVKRLDLCHPKQKKGVLMAIQKLNEEPTADVVEVVRCKECEYCDPVNKHCDNPMGTTLPISRKDDDYCSYGKRKEVEE